MREGTEKAGWAERGFKLEMQNTREPEENERTSGSSGKHE